MAPGLHAWQERVTTWKLYWKRARKEKTEEKNHFSNFVVSQREHAV